MSLALRLYSVRGTYWKYRLNAACPVFLLRTLSGTCNENRSIKCCRAVFSTLQAFLSTGGFLHIKPQNFCDFIISTHEKCKNLRGGADSGRGLPLDVFADLHKRIRGFSPAKTAGFLHKTESEHVCGRKLREPLRFLKFPFRAQIIKSQKLCSFFHALAVYEFEGN